MTYLLWLLLAIYAVVALSLLFSRASYYAGNGRIRKKFVFTGWRRVYPLLIATIPTFFLGLVVVAIVSPSEYRAEREARIVALGDSSDSHGSFFLGSGYIDEDQVYTYMQKADNGGLSMSSLPTEHVLVFEDAEPNTARIVTFEAYNPAWMGNVRLDRQRYEIHVPAGTVVQNYAVDVTK